MTVLDTLDFINVLERISVIVEFNGSMYLYCKGSPEMLKGLCKQVPADYQEKMDNFTQKGLRILSMAYREISKHEMGLPRDQKE